MNVPAQLFLIVMLFVAMGDCFEIDVIRVQVGCDNIVNSGLKVDRCGVCGGNEESCKVVQGVFDKTDLDLGYNFVTRIPKGATRINITELSRSLNHLALNSSDSNYINCCDWGVLDEPRTYSIPGTYVKYKRPIQTDKGESMIIPGPVTEDLDVWLFFQRENPGIFYEYTTKRSPDNILPTTASSHIGRKHKSETPDSFLDINNIDTDVRSRKGQGEVQHSVNKFSPIWSAGKISRRRTHSARGNSLQNTASPKRTSATVQHEVDGFHRNTQTHPRYRWVDKGFGPCSKSCAEGRQTSMIRCVDGQKPTKTVSEKYCNNLPKPPIMMRKCNRQACPAYYGVGRWSRCSRTCGYGRQVRKIQCYQLFPNNYTAPVNNKRCRKLRKPIAHQQCEIQKCPKWMVKTPWSQCSVQCGLGKQIRRVACVSSSRKEIPWSFCRGTPAPLSEQPCRMGSCLTAWFNTDWGTCSSDCSSGMQTRDVICVNTAKSPYGCSSDSKPPDNRKCTQPSCGDKYEWFAGQWGPCTDECGSGTQDRRVTCVVLSADGEMKIAEDINLCNIEDKPTIQQTCNTQPCGSRWYFSQWEECTVTCGGGVQRRNVLCLDSNGKHSARCKEVEKPISSKICNSEDCKSFIDPSCVDVASNCRMIHQASLCSYYKEKCCQTCKGWSGKK